ncbi:Putative Zinc finger, CCHC-type [Septoria linicola]|uniref:Zinc finger, CCHC-type n=1 Tax=Septoria linicola TaxID=215465 RepID=A0A9Q9AY00_9PEZI|nr:putative Zinc finger, CCHC-type [Septoria linicola]USW53856.1 Putative Zinc finger, CCHC-type [Septoria linicola]
MPNNNNNRGSQGGQDQGRQEPHNWQPGDQRTTTKKGQPYTGPCRPGQCSNSAHSFKICPAKSAKKCTVQNCPTYWQHDTKDCPNRQNGNSTQQQVKCDNCGKDGHKSENCRSKKTDDIFVNTSSTAAPYCKLCNEIDHRTENCESELSFSRHQISKIRCIRCKEKGHSHDVCLNPAGKTCRKCFAPGHDRNDCPLKSNKALKTPTEDMKGEFEERFYAKTKDRSKFHIGPHYVRNVTQQARWELEQEIDEYDKNERKGRTLAEQAIHDQEVAKKWRLLEIAERDIFQQSSNLRAELSSVNAVPLSTGQVARGVALANGLVATGRAYRLSQSSQSKSLPNTTMSGRKHSIGWHKRAEARQELEDMKEGEKLIFAKIASSRSRYRAELYNNVITMNEYAIMNTGVVTNLRMGEIKKAMLQGARIWRDPQAMAALFARKIPRCLTCGSHGAIADQHFETIKPESSATELYAIEDDKHPAWGIFIVFFCAGRCSKNDNGLPNYIFTDIDFDSYPGIDWANDPEYKPHGDMLG